MPSRPAGRPWAECRWRTDVLKKMAAAYRTATTYEDFGTAELLDEGGTLQRRADFKVAFQRPNKLRMNFYQGEVVCDGKKWYAFCKDIPGQAVLRDAPQRLNLQMLQADTVMNQALNSGFAGASPQLLLLLEENPLGILLDGVRDQDLTLGESARIGDYDCYCVCFKRNEGKGEYWIDQKTFVLRRMEFHQPPMPPAREGEPGTEGVGMVANFERARLGGTIDDPLAFKVEVAEGVECHRALLDAGPYALIGKKIDEFHLTDMQGKAWSSQALAGKVVALHLWRSNAEACLPVIPALEQAYEKFKTDDKVAIWAINLDGPQIDTKTIEETARQWKLSAPILRDPEIETPKLLRISALPATFFLDAKGVLQDCIVGDSPLAAAATTAQVGETAGRRGTCRTGLGAVPAAVQGVRKRSRHALLGRGPDGHDRAGQGRAAGSQERAQEAPLDAALEVHRDQHAGKSSSSPPKPATKLASTSSTAIRRSARSPWMAR